MSTIPDIVALTTGAADTVLPTTLSSGSIWADNSMIWMVVFGFVIAFILAFAVGANDVANSFGTTVGAKVLTMRSACILASIFETAGAVLLGAKVGETIRKGIIDVSVYNETENGIELLMMGQISAMCGSAIWQLIATWCSLPVSGTHSIVGACIGFSLVAIGSAGINWAKLGLIISSWFISPIASGIMSTLLYVFVKNFILEKGDPLESGLFFLPLFYGFTIGVNIFSVLFSGAPLLGLDMLPLYAVFLITFFGMMLVAIFVYCWLVPRLRNKAMQANDEEKQEEKRSSNSSLPLTKGGRKYSLDSDPLRFARDSRDNDLSRSSIPLQLDETTVAQLLRTDATTNGVLQDRDNEKEDSYNSTNSLSKSSEKEKSEADEDEDPSDVKIMFSFLQILTACFGSFAHGGNDVSNAIGPLIALWLIYTSGTVAQVAATPWYLLIYGGIGIVCGLWVLGRRVIKTIGQDLTKVTASRGFCVELMTAVTVLIASNVGIPVSTTHCKVGAVVSIGWYRSRDAVKWSMVRNIALAWFVTVPISGVISALCMFILMKTNV